MLAPHAEGKPIMSKNTKLAAELHRAYENARAARATVTADAEAATRALEAHDASTPVPFDDVAAAVELAQAEFADRIGGTATADAVRDRLAAERDARDAVIAAHGAMRLTLAAEAQRLARQMQAAEASVADLEASRRSGVAAAAAERRDVELGAYQEHLLALIAGAQRITALNTIVREPERSPHAARTFDAFAIHLPSLGAFIEGDARLSAIGAQDDGGTVRCAPANMATKAGEQFPHLTDELCGVQVPR